MGSYQASPQPSPAFEMSDKQDNAQEIHREEIRKKDRSKEKRKSETRGKWMSPLMRILISLSSLSIFLVIWNAFAYYSGNSAIIAGPIPVMLALAKLLDLNNPLSAQGIQSVYAALLLTLEVIVVGFSLSLVVGIPTGILLGLSKTAEVISDPWMSVTSSVPIVALIPALYFAIGGGFFADVFVAFVLSVFTVVMNTHLGVRSVSNSLAEVGKTFGASKLQLITKIILPASLPDLVAGMRIAIGRALLGTILAEAILGGNKGLGGLMMTYQEILETPSMMATVVLIALLGIILLQGPKLLERHLFRWKETERISRGVKN